MILFELSVYNIDYLKRKISIFQIKRNYCLIFEHISMIMKKD